MLGNTIPASYEDINLYNSSFSPSMVHCRDTRLQRYFRKYLCNRVSRQWTIDGENEELYRLISS